MADEKIPIVIPLGHGSRHGNAELKYLLRSIASCAEDVGAVYLVTDEVPSFVDTDKVCVVDVYDRYPDNKDANLHNKVLETIRRYGLREFVFCADDNAFLKPVRLRDIPKMHSIREVRDILDDPRPSTWRRRVAATVRWAESRGVHLTRHLECHAPQLFDGERILAGMEGVDYRYPPGLVIYTTWRVVSGDWEGTVSMSGYKWTMEKDAPPADDLDAIRSKFFLGYNDVGVQLGALDLLERLYPAPCRYERTL